MELSILKKENERLWETASYWERVAAGYSEDREEC